MPVLKYERLVQFAHENLWAKHKDRVPTGTLDFQIQRHMGIGKRSIQRIRMALKGMNLMMPDPDMTFGRWVWTENGKAEMRRLDKQIKQ